MKEIQKKINACSLCGNKPKLTKSSLQIGKIKILIVGESPAKDGWIESQQAFYNTKGKLQASGRVLTKLLNGIDLTLSDVYFTEVCKCLISRDEFAKCAKNCLPYLIEQINNIDCELILPMGAYATEAILDKKINRFADYAGKTFIKQFGDKQYKVIPIYHPSPANPKGYSNNLPIFNKIKNEINIL